MSSREEEGGWNQIHSEGTRASFNSKTDFTGCDIFFDLTKEKTTVSSYFIAKWRTANRNLQGIVNNGILLTTVTVGENHYPVYANITHGFTPLILGRDFFHAYDWHLTDKGSIDTPGGRVQLMQNLHGYHQIDTQLAEQVHKCDEIL